MRNVYTLRTIDLVRTADNGSTLLSVRVWNDDKANEYDTVRVWFRSYEDAEYFAKVSFANECVELQDGHVWIKHEEAAAA